MDDRQKSVFRAFEVRLDEHYKTLGLWKMPREQAIYAVLTVFDSVQCSLFEQGIGPNGVLGRIEKLERVRDGVIQAVRWLCRGLDEVGVRSTSDDLILRAADEFTKFAGDYAMIEIFHMMYGRDLATVDVDEEQQVVTFQASDGPGLSSTATSHELCMGQKEHADEFGQGVLGKEGGILVALEAVERTCVDGRIELKGLTREIFDLSKPVMEMLLNVETMGLEDNDDLAGFSVGEYRAFCRAVVTWGWIAVMGYKRMVVEDGIPPQKCMPTQVVNRQEFIDIVTSGVGLSVEKTGAIVERLRYCPDAKSDVVLHPFLMGGENIAWSPCLFNASRHERNMLKVMARGGGVLKARADDLIGGRERKFLRQIGARFARCGYQHQIRINIDADEDATDVDIMLYRSAKPDQLLLVEGKTILAPDEINEVHDATEKCLAGQEQLSLARSILGRMPERRKAELFKIVDDWREVRDVFLVVITADGEPSIALDHAEIPVISYDVFRRRLRSCDFSSPRRFWSACVRRSWLKEELSEGKLHFKSIPVGDITYRLPMQEF